MKRKIERLSEFVINQIAAGEVVENPASIVKELVENCLDANSTCVSIETLSGGHERILIEDNGFGMNPEDAKACLERHATSKISNIEDLNSLGSMGFRGEALAAIASVSKLELKTSDGANATRVVADAGKISRVEPCARNQGTTIEIRSLFYNVPARKKFQKSIRASQAQIKRTIETIALANPEVAFILNGEEFAHSSLSSRIEEILGVHEHKIAAKRVSGFVAAPSKAMSNRTGQYLFINRRPIFSFLISKAVKEAFSTRIAEHSFPRFVLFLDIDPSEVDVNVHPQKREARFKNESKIFSEVRAAVEKAFSPKETFVEPITFEKPTFPTLNHFSEQFPSIPMKIDEVDLNFIYQDRILGIFGKYLLIQKENLVLIDLKAAHARVLFESFSFEKKEPQALMIPIEIEMTSGDEEAVLRLGQIGVEARILRKTLVIDALPTHLDREQFPKFFEQFKEGKKLEEISAKFISSSKRSYSLEEAKELWKQVKKCQDSCYDPLGNPISKEILQTDLDWLMKKHEK